MIAWRSLVYAPLAVLLIWAVIVDVRERTVLSPVRTIQNLDHVGGR